MYDNRVVFVPVLTGGQTFDATRQAIDVFSTIVVPW